MTLKCDDCKNTDKEVLYCWDCNKLKLKHNACTKCTVKPIAKEHMCEECYTDHCQWLRELSAPKQDDDQWYTLYESGVK